jgi:hypothetical protein
LLDEKSERGEFEMGNQMSTQDAAAQEAAARSQLVTVQAAIATENASHKATMDTLRVQEEQLTAQINLFALQNTPVSPNWPDSVPSTSTPPGGSGATSPGWTPPKAL